MDGQTLILHAFTCHGWCPFPRVCSSSAWWKWPLWHWENTSIPHGDKALVGLWLCPPWYWFQDTCCTASSPQRGLYGRYEQLHHSSSAHCLV